VDDLPALVADPGYVGFTLPTEHFVYDFVQPLTTEDILVHAPMSLTCPVLMGHLTTAHTTIIRRNLILPFPPPVCVFSSSCISVYTSSHNSSPIDRTLLPSPQWSSFERMVPSTSSLSPLHSFLVAVSSLAVFFALSSLLGRLEFCLSLLAPPHVNSPSYDVEWCHCSRRDIPLRFLIFFALTRAYHFS